MRAFCAEAGFELGNAHVTKAFAALLADERLGAVWLLATASEIAGYLVLTWCYSMERGGSKAALDDFFVVPHLRSLGLGQAALATLPDLCREACGPSRLKLASLTLPPKNYRRAGFEPALSREVLTLALSTPSHQL